MAQVLPQPQTSNETHRVTLGGTLYNFKYQYNTRDQRWRLSITDSTGVDVMSGLKLMENQLLLERYNTPNFSHGDLYCLRSKQTDNPVGRDNLGYGLEYELAYLTNEEVLELDNL